MGASGESLVFGPGALVLVGLYLVSMIGIGWLGRRRRQSDDLADFYLAGRSLGLGVLFLTLYATQYSGNTLFGYTGKTYRIGFEWTVSVLFMYSIIILAFRLNESRSFSVAGRFAPIRKVCVSCFGGLSPGLGALKPPFSRRDSVEPAFEGVL